MYRKKEQIKYINNNKNNTVITDLFMYSKKNNSNNNNNNNSSSNNNNVFIDLCTAIKTKTVAIITNNINNDITVTIIVKVMFYWFIDMYSNCDANKCQ